MHLLLLKFFPIFGLPTALKNE